MKSVKFGEPPLLDLGDSPSAGPSPPKKMQHFASQEAIAIICLFLTYIYHIRDLLQYLFPPLGVMYLCKYEGNTQTFIWTSCASMKKT